MGKHRGPNPCQRSDKIPCEMLISERMERWNKILTRVSAEETKVKYFHNGVRHLLREHKPKCKIEPPTGAGRL